MVRAGTSPRRLLCCSLGRFEGVNNLLRISFALIFMVVRVLYWPIVAARHLFDTFGSVQV